MMKMMSKKRIVCLTAGMMLLLALSAFAAERDSVPANARLLEGEDHEGEDHEDEDHELHAEDHHDQDKPWGAAIGAALIVNCASLVGVVLVAFSALWLKGRCCKVSAAQVQSFLHIYMPSIAVGALLATTVFLIIPEALHLLGGGGDSHEEHEEHEDEDELRRTLEEHEEHEGEEHNEAAASWKFGASVLGGYLIPYLLSSVFPTRQEALECEHEHQHPPFGEPQGEGDADPGTLTDDEEGGPDDCSSCNLSVQGTEVESMATGSTAMSRAIKYGGVAAVSKSTRSKKNRHENDDHQQGFEEVLPVQEEPVYDNDSTHSPKANSTKELQEEQPKDLRLAFSLLVGDFFHNFADGIFIGNAFLLCNTDLAIIVAASTFFHELTQELADYFLLVHHCDFSPLNALVLNFVSGMSVVLGVVVILAIDVPSVATGAILAVSAGVYLFIALSEVQPRIDKHVASFWQKVLAMGCFILGAVPIGLVLLNHSHCDGEH